MPVLQVMQTFQVCLIALVLSLVAQAQRPQTTSLSQETERPTARTLTLAVLDFGDSTLARKASDLLATNFKHESSLVVSDRDQVRAAARGAGYAGGINLSLTEARELGAVLGCDFFIVGDAQTLRRSPSTGAVYFESYASIFLVSARTGRLTRWERPNFRSSASEEAEQSLVSELSGPEVRLRFSVALHRAHDDERGERELKPLDQQIPVIAEAPDDDKSAAAEGLRLPRPYRRFMPAYPESAAVAEAEATVDVLIDLDAGGEVTRVEVVRWAGFGLDEATVENVRRLHFFPAMRDGVAIPIRVLLRYNFRKPPK
jgi:TonB family protein